MKKSSTKPENLLPPQNVRLDAYTDNLINMIVVKNEESKADTIRRLLRDAAERELSEETLDSVMYIVRQALKAALEPFEERVMKMHAKSAIASGTAMYTTMMVFEELGKNGIALHDQSRKKAIQYIKTPAEQLNMSEQKTISNE